MSIRAERHAELERAAALTEADMRAAVERLPEAIRAQLARGPMPYRYDCRVCAAFRSCDLTRGLPEDDARWVVFNYHEVPKLRMRSAEDQWSGPCAADVYARCRAIYRAAAEIEGASQ